MIAFRPVETDDEGRLLRLVAATGQGFLGTNPVLETVPRMQHRLEHRRARLLTASDAVGVVGLAGYVANPHNPRQADVDVVAFIDASADELLAGLLEFLHHFERVESVVKLLEPDDGREAAFRRLGFAEVGRLRRHTFARGGYHDQIVLHRRSTVASKEDR